MLLVLEVAVVGVAVRDFNFREELVLPQCLENVWTDMDLVSLVFARSGVFCCRSSLGPGNTTTEWKDQTAGR